MSRAIDMTNTITKNGVYVIERIYTEYKKEAMWRCECPICHRTDWIVRGTELRKTTKMCKKCNALNNLKDNKLNLKNKRFGKLIALNPTEERSGTSIIWKCKCDCGNICFASASHLTLNQKASCGCDSSSIGERIIEDILKKNNIYFEKEKIFKEIPSLRFDFFVNNSYIIEFDGKQHFKNGYFEDVKEIHKRDLIKNKYCFDNNIPIIRIPFDKIKKINYNELDINKSNFILRKENEDEYYRCM